MPTWAGYGLSSFADTYLKTRAEMSREDEMDQIAQLRHQQSQSLAQQTQDRDDLAEGARRMASPDASVSDVTVSPGTPATLPSSDTVAGDDQQAAPNTQPGGVAPDATLGNQAQTTTATPGAPGTAPVTKRYKTETDAMKTLGPELYGRLASTQQGRAMLQQQGVTPDVEIAKQQKTATAMQEVRTKFGEAEKAAKDGRAGDAAYATAAAYERLAEIQDNPQMQAHFLEKAADTRKSAQADAADPRANEDYRNIWQAYEKVKADPSADNLLGFQTAATGAQTKLGQQFGQKALDGYATHHANDQFNTELMQAMRTTGGDVPKAISQMMKNPTPAFMQALPKLLESKAPGIQKAFGLEDEDKLLGNGVEARMALMQTKSQGLDINTPEGMRSLIKNYQAIVKQTNEAKTKGGSPELVKVFKPQLDLAMKNYERAMEEYTKAAANPKARVAAEKHLNETRDQANELVDAVNEYLPGPKMPHIGDTSAINTSKSVAVPPGADRTKISNRYAELVKQGRDALGHVPTSQELAKIKADANAQLQKEGLLGPPGVKG